MILDTSQASWAAMNLPNSLELYVFKILWEPNTNTDTFSIQNADGMVLVAGRAEAGANAPGNGQVFNFIPPLRFTKTQGWFLQQISASNKLYIWFK